MPKLAVLDLSSNGKLNELPYGISELVSLQYLNLSYTGISHLPKGLQELRKLIHLDLEETSQLESIAGISNLQNLKVLKLLASGISWDLNTVKELETLEHLEILTTSFNLFPCLDQFLSSNRLTSCTQTLTISKQLESFGIIWNLPITMDKLRCFNISHYIISEIKLGNICIKSKTLSPSPLQNPRNPCFLSLTEVYIQFCECLKELTLLMFAPNLKWLDIDSVYELEDIVNKEKACDYDESSGCSFSKARSTNVE